MNDRDLEIAARLVAGERRTCRKRGNPEGYAGARAAQILFYAIRRLAEQRWCHKGHDMDQLGRCNGRGCAQCNRDNQKALRDSGAIKAYRQRPENAKKISAYFRARYRRLHPP